MARNGNKSKKSTTTSSKKDQKKVQVARGKKITKAKEKKLKKRPGGSNTGTYQDVSPKEFAGKAGGTSPYSYPINTRARAKAALKLAHNAPDEKGIKEAVYKKWPQLRPKKNK